MYYIDQETKEKKLLNECELSAFSDLIEAIKDGDKEDITSLIEEEPIIANACDEDGITALKFALNKGEEIVRTLVSLGADPYSINERGLTVIHLLDDITDSVLKGQLCDAMNLETHDTAAILARLHNIEARARVEAEYAARELAEAEAKNLAYEQASTIQEKMKIDPSRAAGEYLNQDHIREADGTISRIENNQQVRTAITDNDLTPEIIDAVNSLYNEKSFTKNSLLNSEKDDSLISLVAGIFKETPHNFDSLFSNIESILDSLGIDLTKLIHLVSIYSGSGHLPMYHGGFPGGDSGGDFGGSGVAFDVPPLDENEYVVAVLGNVTIIATEEDHSM